MMMMEVKNYEITYFLRNDCYQTIVMWEDFRLLSLLLCRRKLLPVRKKTEILRIEIMLTQASHPCIYPLANCFKCIIKRSSTCRADFRFHKKLKSFLSRSSTSTSNSSAHKTLLLQLAANEDMHHNCGRKEKQKTKGVQFAKRKL